MPLVGCEFWRRYFAGDHDALVDIVRHCHGDLLRRVRYRLSVNPIAHFVPQIDALDVCQRIYLRLWSSRHVLPERSVESIEAYLTRLTQNAIQSELRTLIAARRDARRLARSYDESESQESPSIASPSLEGQLDQQEEVTWYMSLVRQTDRELLSLVLAGLDWHEIAKRLALNHDTVRMRFKRLTLRLKSRERTFQRRTFRATTKTVGR